MFVTELYSTGVCVINAVKTLRVQTRKEALRLRFKQPSETNDYATYSCP
jgi:hypothetical protein